MTLFLRSKKGRTVVEVDVSRHRLDDGSDYADLSVAFDMVEVVSLLAQRSVAMVNLADPSAMSSVLTRMSLVAADLENLNELRGWYFESFLTDNPSAGYEKSNDAIKERLLEFGNKYDLTYVED